MSSTTALVDEKGHGQAAKDDPAGSSDRGASDTLPNDNKGWLFPTLETVSSYIQLPKASSLTSWYSTEGKQRSDDIDRWLEAEGIRSKTCFRAILLGDRDQTGIFWKQSRLLSEPLSEEEQRSSLSVVRKIFLQEFWGRLDEIDRVQKKRLEERSDGSASLFLETIQRTLETRYYDESEMAQAERLAALCQDPALKENFERERSVLEDKDGQLLGFEKPDISTCSCEQDQITFTQLQRIFAPNYQVTEHDWFHFDHRIPSIVRETQVNMMDYSLAITGVSMKQWRKSRWSHLLDGCTCIVFVADTARYCEMVGEEGELNLLRGTLDGFEGISNSEMLLDKPLHLVLANMTAFKAKLAVHPLADFYPEYTGSDDEEATQFMANMFLGLSKKREHITVSSSDITALTGIGKVLDDLERAILKPLVEELVDSGVAKDL